MGKPGESTPQPVSSHRAGSTVWRLLGPRPMLRLCSALTVSCGPTLNFLFIRLCNEGTELDDSANLFYIFSVIVTSSESKVAFLNP